MLERPTTTATSYITKTPPNFNWQYLRDVPPLACDLTRAIASNKASFTYLPANMAQ